MTNAIDPLPTPPNRATDTQSAFSSKADSFLGALPTFQSQANAAAIAMNNNATNDTSSSSVVIGTGSKSLTVSASKGFVAGMWLSIADTAAPTTNWMLAQITSYNASTGAMVVNVISIGGSGTKTAWTISQSNLLPNVVGDSGIVVHTGNGCGSTNTVIRRYTTILSQTGSSVTYADSATLGSSFTINEAGVYTISLSDLKSGSPQVGISKNTTQPGSSIAVIPVAERLAISECGGTNFWGYVSHTTYLAVNDVIRPHFSTTFTDATSNAKFSIRKIGL